MIDSPLVQGLDDAQVAALRHLCDQFRLELAVVFGSRARGDATAKSDLDLLVAPLSLRFDLLSFEAAAQHIVGRPRVDVTMLHPALSTTVAWEALREAIVLWEPVPGTRGRECAAWHSLFLDEAPRRREQARNLMQMFRCR